MQPQFTGHPLKRVSIITATLNSANTLEKMVLSVRAQSYPGIELIIVDGGSHDATLQLCAQYRSHIAQLINGPDQGIYDAFNKGLKQATGEIIYFLNGDDYLYDNRVIEAVVREFETSPGRQIVYGNTLVINEATDYRYYRGRSLGWEDFKTGEMPPHQGFFISRELLEQVGWFDLEYQIAADFDFIIRCFRAAGQRSYYLNRTIAVFSDGGVSSNPEQQGLMNREQQRIIRKYFGEGHVSNLQREQVSGLYQVWLETLLLQKKGITHPLHELQVRKVAIYGTMKIARYLSADLKAESLEVVCFLDRNENMQQQRVAGLPVYAPEWLVAHGERIDAILVSIEGQHDIEVIAGLKSLVAAGEIKVVSWKELVRWGSR